MLDRVVFDPLGTAFAYLLDMKISEQASTIQDTSPQGESVALVCDPKSTRKAGALRIAAVISALMTTVVLLVPSLCAAASKFNISLNGDSDTQMGAALKMIFILTVITLGPTVLLTMTSFVRIVVVFSLLKTALGTQTTPPQQVLMGLALFLTVAIMWPVGQDIYTRGVGPYMEGEIEAKEALYQTITPLRKFMLKQTREADLMLFYEINNEARPNKPADVEMHLLIPAFVISELRTAFEMGFLVFIPFLLLDMVVASLTMSLGLVMLPPALLSMPLKLMLFVLADGWNLMVGSLVRSFG